MAAPLSDLGVAASVVPAFPAREETSVIPIEDLSRLDESTAIELARTCGEAGFAVFELLSDAPSADAVQALARALGLGEPFVPPLYARNSRDGTLPLVARISASRNAGGDAAKHPSFGTTEGQKLHTDGTLQPIGEVKTSILLCECPAAIGGDSVLFNATGAFAALLTRDPDAAAALAADAILVRQANIYGCADSHNGPAFAIQGGVLVTRYSTGATDRWDVPPDVDGHALRRGVAELERMSEPGSPYLLELSLGAGQGLVMANARIAHGRRAYTDDEAQRRCMYRALYTRAPRAASQRSLHLAGR